MVQDVCYTGGSKLGWETAYLQNLRMSNLDGSLSAIMPYFSMKCMAISPYALPATTTFAPLQRNIAQVCYLHFACLPDAQMCCIGSNPCT